MIISNLTKVKAIFFRGFFLSVCIFLLLSCKKTESKLSSLKTLSHDNSEEIKDLKEKLSNIENILAKINKKENKAKVFKESRTYIKSITFREEEEGNRIRIYWSDGKRSDLICTKEQATWACG